MSVHLRAKVSALAAGGLALIREDQEEAPPRYLEQLGSFAHAPMCVDAGLTYMRLLSPLLIELGLFLVLAHYDWLRTGAFPPIVVILHQTQWSLALIVALYLLVRFLVSLRSHGPPADADRQ